MNAIETHTLRKVYPGTSSRKRNFFSSGELGSGGGTHGTSEVVALDGLDLTIPAGEFFGLLGPNGAGKTTTIGILTTRVRATSGSATVAGADVAREDTAVRQRIGVVPQRPNPDRSLNVEENLLYHAAYFGIPRAKAVARTQRLLEQLGIAEKRTAMVDTLSGGQQQRLMIARALVHQPSVIFLDEPTVGLDPQARHALWDILRDLHSQGRTIVMTTHYMEEAEKLCERLAIVDHGKLLAVDTPDGLRAKAPGGTLIELSVDGDAEQAAGRARLVPGISRVEAVTGAMRAYSDRGGEVLPALIRAAEESGRTVQDIHLGTPSLETLFIALTGRKLQ